MWLEMLKPNVANILKAIVTKAPQNFEELRISEIAEQAGVCPTTARSYVKYLVANGYIQVWREATNKPFCFEVCPKAIEELHELS